jgi:hypothetical protein
MHIFWTAKSTKPRIENFRWFFFLSVEESKPFAFFFELQVQETGVLGGGVGPSKAESCK